MSQRIRLSDSAAQPAVRLRERGQIERRRRVKQAALEVFRERGYDAATTREIAKRAEVAIGTIFVYAQDKRELLMMLMNDRLDELGEEEIETIDPSVSLLDQLMRFFATRYRFWFKDQELARCTVRETFSNVRETDEVGPETLRVIERLPRYTAKISDLIRQRQVLGRARSDVDPALAARLIMAIYLNELRHWLAGRRVNLERGLAGLRSLLALALVALEGQSSASSSPLARSTSRHQTRRIRKF